MNPITDSFCNLCARNSSLRILLVRCCEYFDPSYDLLINDSLKITKSIPLLEQLELFFVGIDKAIDVINAFNNHTPLKTVIFRLISVEKKAFN